MKFNDRSILVGMSLLALTPALAMADANAVNALKSAIGERTLECQIQEAGQYRPAPPLVELSITKSSRSESDIIFATAHYNGARYGVNGGKIANNTLVITLSNDIDGPHSQDKLEIPLAELNRLRGDPGSKIRGSDRYSEDWDGTSTVLKMSCVLE